MRINSFHFAVLSLRVIDPTFTMSADQPVAKCATETSSVSPERAETITLMPFSRAAAHGCGTAGHGAGLVDLDQHRIGFPGRGRPVDPFSVRH